MFVDIHDNANKVAINLYRVNADKAITVDLSGEVLGANGTPVPQISMSLHRYPSLQVKPLSPSKSVWCSAT